MKTLKLKKIKLLFINLIAIAFLIPSLGWVGGGLYAQDPRLFENTWYLHDLVIDGDSNIPPVNAEIPFVPADFHVNGVYTGMCDEGRSGLLDYIGTTEFEILQMAFFTGGCHQNHPHNQNYSGLYQNFWSSLNGYYVPYEIIVDGPNRTLIITASNGDYAIYKNEVPLSIEDFSNSELFIFPNPVKETLHIYNATSQLVIATVYGLNGKLLQRHHLGTSTSTIDVKALNPGLYFVVFESEAGERVSKKFVKK